MRKADKIIKEKKNTEKYVKLSDVYREFGEWSKMVKDEIDPIELEHFHYYLNFLPTVELDKDKVHPSYKNDCLTREGEVKKIWV